MKLDKFEKINVAEKYNLPEKVVFCKKCVISNQRPRIEFGDDGVCNACHYWESKDSVVDWKEREKELKDLCDRFRRNDGRHDIIVPSSGGKDSGYVAHQLKYKYNMNPLTVTWSPHIYTPIGWENFQALIHAGFDNILCTPNGLVHRKMTRLSTIEMGEPFQPFIYGQVNFPLHMALKYDVPLIMDGENGEAEYGGDPKTAGKTGFTAQDADQYWFSDKPFDYWFEHGFTKQDMEIYTPPPLNELAKVKVERHFFSYYKNWRPQENFYYTSENTGFKVNPDGRSEATYSKYASLDDKIDPFHFYFALLKFGIARATSDAAHEIREGLIDREEAVALVKKYDDEFPSKYFKAFLDYCWFTEEDFWKICERWRNLNLWENQNGKWRIKEQVV